jgi:hypothetical protein
MSRKNRLEVLEQYADRIVEPSAATSDNSPTKSPAWSKEALFGLLGVLVVIVVPFISLLIRFCMARYTTAATWKESGTRVLSPMESQQLTGLDPDVDIESCRPGSRRSCKRKWRRTSSKGRTRTVVLVV